MNRPWAVIGLTAAALVLAAEVRSAPAPFDPGPRRDAAAVEWQRLRGTWVVTRHESNGRPQESLLNGLEVELNRGTLWLITPMACRLRPGDRPRRFDARSEATQDWPEER